MDRPGLRKGQGPGHIFTGHHEWDRTRATVPSAPSDTASLSDLGAAGQLVAVSGMVLRKGRLPGSKEVGSGISGGIQAPFVGIAPTSGRECPSCPVLLCPTPLWHY